MLNISDMCFYSFPNNKPQNKSPSHKFTSDILFQCYDLILNGHHFSRNGDYLKCIRRIRRFLWNLCVWKSITDYDQKFFFSMFCFILFCSVLFLANKQTYTYRVFSKFIYLKKKAYFLKIIFFEHFHIIVYHCKKLSAVGLCCSFVCLLVCLNSISDIRE